MKVTVQSEWTGHKMRQKLSFKVLNPNVKGRRVYAVEYVNREAWDRKASSEALTLLDCLYQYKRSNVRFAVS